MKESLDKDKHQSFLFSRLLFPAIPLGIEVKVLQFDLRVSWRPLQPNEQKAKIFPWKIAAIDKSWVDKPKFHGKSFDLHVVYLRFTFMSWVGNLPFETVLLESWFKSFLFHSTVFEMNFSWKGAAAHGSWCLWSSKQLSTASTQRYLEVLDVSMDQPRCLSQKIGWKWTKKTGKIELFIKCSLFIQLRWLPSTVSINIIVAMCGFSQVWFLWTTWTPSASMSPMLWQSLEQSLGYWKGNLSFRS